MEKLIKLIKGKYNNVLEWPLRYLGCLVLVLVIICSTVYDGLEQIGPLGVLNLPVRGLLLFIIFFALIQPLEGQRRHKERIYANYAYRVVNYKFLDETALLENKVDKILHESKERVEISALLEDLYRYYGNILDYLGVINQMPRPDEHTQENRRLLKSGILIGKVTCALRELGVEAPLTQVRPKLEILNSELANTHSMIPFLGIKGYDEHGQRFVPDPTYPGYDDKALRRFVKECWWPPSSKV